MTRQSAEDDFWDTLGELLRPDAPDHNRKMVRDFSKASQISEETIWRKLRGRLNIPSEARR